MMRDNQKSKVYGAENHVARLLDSVAQSQTRTLHAYGSAMTLPDEVKFGEVDSVQRYVDAVLGLSWIRETWPKAGPIKVRARRGQAKATYCMGVIAIPPYQHGRAWALREIVVLHEVAHHLAFGERHGPVFAGTFLSLVSAIIGPEVGLLLGASMHEAGVKISLVNQLDKATC